MDFWGVELSPDSAVKSNSLIVAQCGVVVGGIHGRIEHDAVSAAGEHVGIHHPQVGTVGKSEVVDALHVHRDAQRLKVACNLLRPNQTQNASSLRGIHQPSCPLQTTPALSLGARNAGLIADSGDKLIAGQRDGRPARAYPARIEGDDVEILS